MDPMVARPTDRVSGTTDGHAVELSTEVVHERLRRDILRGALDPTSRSRRSSWPSGSG
jgi:hypothetical protein